MSLLLDARKKSQQAQSAQEGGHASQIPGLSLDVHPGSARPVPDTKPNAQSPENARSAGQNLFAAKLAAPFAAHQGINRNLLFALAGIVLLLMAGAGYLWYIGSASHSRQLRPINPPSVAPLAQPPQPSPATLQPALQKTPVPGITTTGTATPEPADHPQKAQPAPAAPPVKNTPTATLQPHETSPIRVERQKTGQLDPLLRDAYLAYSSGKPDDAQRLYLAMLEKDAHNSDALLGLAAIAQQRGENQLAAQHYARLLVLDPRNAAANAGISALMADDNSENRLKSLLREQGNSAILHFALGNLYAGQSRWSEAQQAYFSACMLESGNAEFAFNLAVSLDHLGQGKLATRHYRRALQLDRLNNAGFDHAQIERRVQELTR